MSALCVNNVFQLRESECIFGGELQVVFRWSNFSHCSPRTRQKDKGSVMTKDGFLPVA